MQSMGKKKIPVILIIDMSKNMEKYQDELQECMDTVLLTLLKAQEESQEIEMYAAGILINDKVISSEKMCALSEFQLDIRDGYRGECKMGLMIQELNRRLTRKDYMAFNGKISAPVILWITNGQVAVDEKDPILMDELNNNGWFKNAHRWIFCLDRYLDFSKAFTPLVQSFVKDPKEGIGYAEDFEIKNYRIGPGTYWPRPESVVKDGKDEDVSALGEEDSFADNPFTGNLFTDDDWSDPFV